MDRDHALCRKCRQIVRIDWNRCAHCGVLSPVPRGLGSSLLPGVIVLGLMCVGGWWAADNVDGIKQLAHASAQRIASLRPVPSGPAPTVTPPEGLRTAIPSAAAGLGGAIKALAPEGRAEGRAAASFGSGFTSTTQGAGSGTSGTTIARSSAGTSTAAGPRWGRPRIARENAVAGAPPNEMADRTPASRSAPAGQGASTDTVRLEFPSSSPTAGPRAPTSRIWQDIKRQRAAVVRP